MFCNHCGEVGWCARDPKEDHWICCFCGLSVDDVQPSRYRTEEEKEVQVFRECFSKLMEEYFRRWFPKSTNPPSPR